jgi:cell wall-associated NlpC family hydrolase
MPTRAQPGSAVAHVGRYSYNLGASTDRGGTVEQMESSEPAGTTCDCSMYVRWAIAQAGIDAGLTTSTQWAANGLLPSTDTPADAPQVSRGVGRDPPAGGYRPRDLIRGDLESAFARA